MIRNYKYSIFTSLIILYLSLSRSDNFNKVRWFDFPGSDKVVHFLLYFFFMSVVIFETRKHIDKIMHLFYFSLIPLCYGIIMEILQTLISTGRSGNIYDVIFNAAGIYAVIILCSSVKYLRNNIIR